MTDKARNFCARLLRGLARRLESKVPEARPAELTELEKFFASLQRLAFKPRHIVDVGANRGHWTRTALRYFPDAHFTLLEPQLAMKELMRDLLESNPRIQLHSVGAGSNLKASCPSPLLSVTTVPLFPSPSGKLPSVVGSKFLCQ